MKKRRSRFALIISQSRTKKGKKKREKKREKGKKEKGKKEKREEKGKKMKKKTKQEQKMVRLSQQRDAKARLLDKLYHKYWETFTPKQLRSLYTLVDVEDFCSDFITEIIAGVRNPKEAQLVLDSLSPEEFKKHEFCLFYNYPKDGWGNLITARLGVDKIPFSSSVFEEIIRFGLKTTRKLAQHMDFGSIREDWMYDYLNRLTNGMGWEELAFFIDNYANWREIFEDGLVDGKITFPDLNNNWNNLSLERYGKDPCVGVAIDKLIRSKAMTLFAFPDILDIGIRREKATIYWFMAVKKLSDIDSLFGFPIKQVLINVPRPKGGEKVKQD